MEKFSSSHVPWELFYYVLKKFYLVLANNHLDQLRCFLIDAMVDQVEKVGNGSMFNNTKYLQLDERYRL